MFQGRLLKLILPVVYSINGCGTGQSQTISHLQMHQIYQIHIPQPRFWQHFWDWTTGVPWFWPIPTGLSLLPFAGALGTSGFKSGRTLPDDMFQWWHIHVAVGELFGCVPEESKLSKVLKGSKGYLWWRDVTYRSNIFFWEYVCGWLWVPLWVRLRHDQAIAVAETVLEGSWFHKSAIASSKLMQIQSNMHLQHEDPQW